MSEGRIKYSQIAEPNLLGPLQKEIEEVNKLLGVTEDQLKAIVTESAKLAKATPLDSYENIEKVEKSIQDTTKAITDLDRIEKDRVKLQQRLADLDDERVKANFDLREQIRLQSKELRDNARAAAASGNAYEVLKNRTNEAQAEFKRLAAEFGANSQQAREARKDFEALDEQLREINEAARDGRRDVGRYERGVDNLRKTFNRFASATVILKIFELLQNSINNNSEGIAEFQKIWVNVTATVSVVAGRLLTVFDTLNARVQRFVLQFRLDFAELGNVLGQNDEQIEELRKQYDALAEDADTDLSSIFSGIGEEISNLIDIQQQLIDDTLAYRRQIVGLQTDIAELIPTQERLRAGFEDDSASLEEQIRAGVAFRASLQETQRLEEQIASRRLRLAQENAVANRNNIAAQEELAQATIEYNQLIADQAAEITATERELQKLRDDVTQLNLDFYIDDFDNRKTVNERIIADETQTFERRRQLLEENLRGAEEVFDLEEAALNKSLEERGKAQLDFDELRQKSSSEEIARIIQESGISEPLAIRALEVLRERRTFLQDNAESQRDLNAAEAESRLLQNDILLQQEALNRLEEEGVDLQLVLRELSDARLQNDIENLRERIAVAEEGSEEFIRLNQELNDKLLEQDQNALEQRKEELMRFAEGAREAFSLLSDITEERAQRRIEAIDEELAAEEERAQRLRELAAEGNEDAEQNLALNEQRQAEIELRRQQQIQRQERQELAFAAIQTYAGKVQAGDPNPLASTISDISVLRAFINALPGFFEGSEKVGDDLDPTISGRDGHIIRVDGSERILTGAQNQLIGKMSNNELAMLAHKENTRSRKAEYGGAVVKEIQELKRITKEKPVYLGSDYDKIADAVISKIRKGNTLERVHKKNGGIWGK